VLITPVEIWQPEINIVPKELYLGKLMTFLLTENVPIADAMTVVMWRIVEAEILVI